MENLRSRTDVRLVNNENYYFIVTKIFGNDLVKIRKSKVTVKQNKPAYVAMCI